MSDVWDKEGEMDEIVQATQEEATNIPEVKYEYLDHPADVQIHAWGTDLREAYEQVAMGMFGYMTEIETVDILEVREVEAEAEDLQGLLFHFLDECLFQFCCEPYFIVRKVVITDWDVGGTCRGSKEGEGGKEGRESKGGKDGTGEENGKESKGEEGAREEKGKESSGEKGGKEGKGGETGSKKDEEMETEGPSSSETDRKDTQTGEASNSGNGSSTSGGAGGTGGEATSNTKTIDSGLLKVRAKLFGEEFDLDKHPQGTEVKAITYASMQVYDKPGQHEVFVIVDI